MKTLVAHLAVLGSAAALVLAAVFAAPADAESPKPHPTDQPSIWTPPPEPVLTPVPATSCGDPTSPTHASCLADATPVSDTEAMAAASVDAEVRAGEVSPLAASGSSSYTPQDLASIYHIPAVQSNATIGIVDVGHDPNTQAQLSYYRSVYGLGACTPSNGCFREVDENGGSAASLPVDSDWVTEIAIDVQAVSAVCPSCHILLVDASSDSATDMGQAALTATRLGASYVSLSFGSPDSSGDRSLGATYYDDPNVTYVAATGDSGYGGGTLFPSSAPNVIAAGGTTVTRNGSSWQQAAWSKSGSGCSPVISLPLLQGLLSSLLTVCDGQRAVSDLSALADPATGLLFYRDGSWWSAGGTSLATPIIASLYALAGNHTSPMSIYQNAAKSPDDFVDVASGRTGTCSQAVLCVAGPGWDGPTGLGTPYGLAGLAATGSAASYSYADQIKATLTSDGSYPTTLDYHLLDVTSGDPLGGVPVAIQASTAGGPFTTVDHGITAADGSLVLQEYPHGATVYRVAYAGDALHEPVTTESVAAGAFTPKVKLRLKKHTLQATAKAPWGAALRGWHLTLQRQAHGHWRTAKTLTTSSRGTAHTKARKAGRYRLAYAVAGWHSGHSATVRLR